MKNDISLSLKFMPLIALLYNAGLAEKIPVKGKNSVQHVYYPPQQKRVISYETTLCSSPFCFTPVLFL
jgi:hypothetical protein